MVIPDELPRSPTGRIPQWVIDEAAARRGQTGVGPDESSVAVVARRAGRGRRWWLGVLVAVAVVAVGVAVNWSTAPWVHPGGSVDVGDLAQEAAMSSTGQQLFYANDPQVLGDDEFTAHCPEASGGCYDAAARSIVVYRYPDQRMHGLVVTVAAHEMLHAAYETLSPAERSEVDQLLWQVVEALDPDDPLLEQVAWSVGDREQVRGTEHFAYVGTQVADLAPRLEEVYGRFFDDRQVVVRAYTTTMRALEGR
ncbi:MAG: hypothetical protein FWF02_13345 [Micrococcales bacterium]|nr:hypothetical protein [Micrococcales bacterium]